jgi:cell division protein FtsB
MTLARSIKRRLRAIAPAMVFLSLTGYFCWNATRGDLGLRAYARRTVDLVAARQSLASAEQERDEWQRKVTTMAPQHLDSDALDEQARQMLDLSTPTDVVVPLKN